MMAQLARRILKRKLPGKPKKVWAKMMLRVLHPRGIPLFRHLWSTPEQIKAYDKKMGL